MKADAICCHALCKMVDSDQPYCVPWQISKSVSVLLAQACPTMVNHLTSSPPKVCVWRLETYLLYKAGFHTGGWKSPPQKLWNWVCFVTGIKQQSFVRSNLRESKFEIFLGGMPPDPPSWHTFRTLLSSCYHPVPPKLKILYETLHSGRARLFTEHTSLMNVFGWEMSCY